MTIAATGSRDRETIQRTEIAATVRIELESEVKIIGTDVIDTESASDTLPILTTKVRSLHVQKSRHYHTALAPPVDRS
jgi:hypothetical protein